MIAQATGFSAAELEGFTADRLTFWWNAVMGARHLERSWTEG